MGTGKIINQPADYVGKELALLQVGIGEKTLRRRRFPTVLPLTESGGLVAVNADNGSLFPLTLTASGWTISNPTFTAATASMDGARIMFRLTQGGAGSYTISFDSAYRFCASIPVPVLSTAVGTMDQIGFFYNAAAGKWDCCAFTKGYV